MMATSGCLRFTLVWTGLVIGAMGLPSDASAQRALASAPPRFDVTLGGGLVTGVSLGDADANLRANATAPQDYRLFATSTELRPSPVVDLRLAGALTSRVWIEGQVQFGKPELKASISDDVEGAPDVTVSERLTQLLLGGGVRIRLDNVQRQAQTVPYVSGGAGVLRQSYPNGNVVEQSPVLYAGAGVLQGLSARQGATRFGVRADVQVLMVNGGLKADDGFTPQLSLTGGVFFAF
jgi:hypothetical protein